MAEVGASLPSNLDRRGACLRRDVRRTHRLRRPRRRQLDRHAGARGLQAGVLIRRLCCGKRSCPCLRRHQRFDLLESRGFGANIRARDASRRRARPWTQARAAGRDRAARAKARLHSSIPQCRSGPSPRSNRRFPPARAGSFGLHAAPCGNPRARDRRCPARAGLARPQASSPFESAADGWRSASPSLPSFAVEQPASATPETSSAALSPPFISTSVKCRHHRPNHADRCRQHQHADHRRQHARDQRNRDQHRQPVRLLLRSQAPLLAHFGANRCAASGRSTSRASSIG